MQALFDNPIILFIIIGILSTIFNRLKGPQQEEPKRQPKPFIEREEVPDYTPETYQPVETQKPQNRLEIEFERKRRETEKKLASLNELKRANEEKARRIKQVTQPKPVSAGVQYNQPNNKVILAEKNRLVEGIILAEVLGPPRARKQHNIFKK